MAKILLVEDDALIIRFYQKAFKFEDFEVDVAEDGEEGLAKAREGKPDLILLDIIMRGMNGAQMLEELKNDPRIKNIPIVVLTNLSEERAAEKMLMLGAVKYIVKSEHDPSEVVDIVREILAGYTRNEIPETKKR